MLDQKDLNEESTEQEIHNENDSAAKHSEEDITEEEVQNSELEETEELSGEEEAFELSESLEEKSVKVKSGRVSFLRSLEAIIVDEVIIAFISIAVLYIFEGILRLFDLFISDKLSMLVIFYFVVTILYFSIMEGSKSGSTFGKKISFTKVVNNEI